MAETMPKNSDQRSTFAQLLSRALDDVSNIFRQELQLLKTETGEKLDMLKGAGIALGVAVVLGAAGFISLLLGINALLIALVSPNLISLEVATWVCPIALGLLVLIICAILVKRALNAFTMDRLKPARTLETVSENVERIERKIGGKA